MVWHFFWEEEQCKFDSYYADNVPFKDINSKREFQRKWLLERRHEYFKDKSCAKCGSKENLELHHLDPKEKVSHRIWSWALNRRQTELDKCCALCRICHKLETKQQYKDKVFSKKQIAESSNGRTLGFEPRHLSSSLSTAAIHL